MDAFLVLISAWWMVGLGVVGAVVVFSVVWQRALADLVFSALELP